MQFECEHIDTALLFPSEAGRQSLLVLAATFSIQLALSGTVQDTLPPVSSLTPTTPPPARPINVSSDLKNYTGHLVTLFDQYKSQILINMIGSKVMTKPKPA